MVEKLTNEEWNRLEEYKEKYQKMGFSTDSLPEGEAFRIIDEIYEFIGRGKPEKWYVDSPMQIIREAKRIMPESGKVKLIPDLWYGSFYSCYVSMYSFIDSLDGVNGEKVKENLRIANESIKLGVFLPLESLCIISKKPIAIRLNQVNQLHCDDGPAVEFADGYGIYFWRGLRVPGEWVKSPNSIDIRDVGKEGNAERRRAMIEIMGYDRFLRESNAIVIHTDQLNGQEIKLYEADFGYTRAKIVEMINGTRENDGTFKHYFMRVPSRITRAKEAIAASFGLSEDDYNPAIET